MEKRYFCAGFGKHANMATVKFKFEDPSIAPVIVENVPSGYSILEVTEENDIHLNHNCGGVCACSTCHVYIQAGEDLLEEISDKEEDFIDRAINPRLESRLGCQCVILEDDAVIEVEIPDQSRIIGHEH
jgi:2Fe-2S ferredoxin